MNNHILHWEPSRSWTGKAKAEDIDKLRNDLAVLHRLTNAKVDGMTLRAESTNLRKEFCGISRDLQEKLSELDECIKSGALETRLQNLCQKQVQAIDDFCAAHGKKMLDLARMAEGTATESRTCSEAAAQILREIQETAAETRSSAEQSIQATARLSDAAASHASAAKTVCQESQELLTKERQTWEIFQRAFAEQRKQFEGDGTALREFAAQTVHALEESARKGHELGMSVTQAWEQSRQLAEEHRHLAHDLATKTEVARQTLQASEELFKRAQEQAAQAVVACEDSRNILNQQRDLMSVFQGKTSAVLELLQSSESRSKEYLASADQGGSEVENYRGDVERIRKELQELTAGLVLLKETAAESVNQAQTGAIGADQRIKALEQLLSDSTEQLLHCRTALQSAQAAQVAHEELARQTREHLSIAENYRSELKSLVLKTQVNLAKIQPRRRTCSFWDRLHWLANGSPELF